MTSDLDIYRSAHALIQQHGEAAAVEGAMSADAMLDEGDLDGAAVWRRIVAAINELLDTRPQNGRRCTDTRYLPDASSRAWFIHASNLVPGDSSSSTSRTSSCLASANWA